MATTLYWHRERFQSTPGVGLLVHDVDDATYELKTAFGAVAVELGLLLGEPDGPGELPGPDSPFPDYGLWVPEPLAPAFEDGLRRRGYEIVEDDRPR